MVYCCGAVYHTEFFLSKENASIKCNDDNAAGKGNIMDIAYFVNRLVIIVTCRPYGTGAGQAVNDDYDSQLVYYRNDVAFHKKYFLGFIQHINEQD